MGFLDRHALRLAFVEPFEDVLQGCIWSENRHAILSQTQQPTPVRNNIVINLKRVCILAHGTAPDHDSQQLHVDGAELINFHVLFRMSPNFVSQPVPKLERNRADPFERKVSAPQDDLKNPEHFRVRDLLHDQRNQALSRLDVHPADLLQTIRILLDRSLHAAREQRIKSCPQSNNQGQHHTNGRHVQVLARHLQNLDHDVSRYFAQLASFGDDLETLWEQRVLRYVIHLQSRELDPTEEALKHFLFGQSRRALQSCQKLDYLRSGLRQLLGVCIAFVCVGHQLLVHVLFG
mmetsp:Transcript_52610/g.140213  ORF Transcript_52610/g.140213 Transcript_52610/m.140213 type:complete len:291 (-) Transcript_52610:483-1355(-)